MTNYKKIFAALALLATASTVATAQTDFGSPLGAGSGVGGAVAPLGLPSGLGIAGAASSRPMPPAFQRGISSARAVFAGAPAGGTRLTNPAGGSVVVSQSISQALGGVLGGAPSPAQTSALSGALGGVPASSATALVTALQAMGANGSRGNLAAVVNAFNAALDAIPAGQPVPTALIAIRAAVAGQFGRSAS